MSSFFGRPVATTMPTDYGNVVAHSPDARSELRRGASSTQSIIHSGVLGVGTQVEQVMVDPAWWNYNLHHVRHCSTPTATTSRNHAEEKENMEETERTKSTDCAGSGRPVVAPTQSSSSSTPSDLFMMAATTGYPVDADYHQDVGNALFDALLLDESHWQRLGTSLRDGGLTVGYTHTSLKVVWFTHLYEERVRKQQQRLQDSEHPEPKDHSLLGSSHDARASSPAKRGLLGRSRSYEAPFSTSVFFPPPDLVRMGSGDGTSSPTTLCNVAPRRRRRPAPLRTSSFQEQLWSKSPIKKLRIPPPEAFRLFPFRHDTVAITRRATGSAWATPKNAASCSAHLVPPSLSTNRSIATTSQHLPFTPLSSSSSSHDSKIPSLTEARVSRRTDLEHRDKPTGERRIPERGYHYGLPRTFSSSSSSSVFSLMSSPLTQPRRFLITNDAGQVVIKDPVIACHHPIRDYGNEEYPHSGSASRAPTKRSMASVPSSPMRTTSITSAVE